MATSIRQASTTGATLSIPIDLKNFAYGVGILVNVPSTVTACLYNVEVTGDNPAKYPDIQNVWNVHDVLTQKTASANSSLAFPVAKVRLNVLAYTGSGNITLSVIQAGGMNS